MTHCFLRCRVRVHRAHSHLAVAGVSHMYQQAASSTLGPTTFFSSSHHPLVPHTRSRVLTPAPSCSPRTHLANHVVPIAPLVTTTHAQVHTCTRTRAHVHVHTCTRAHVHVHTSHVHVHTSHVHVHTCTRHTYTCTRRTRAHTYLAGTLLELKVAEGDVVHLGQQLCIVEAMKSMCMCMSAWAWPCVHRRGHEEY